MSLFASNVRYVVGTTAGERLAASGFQVGLFAVAADWQYVEGANGTEPGAGFYVDHWPTGLTLAWFERFADALRFADCLNIVLTYQLKGRMRVNVQPDGVRFLDAETEARSLWPQTAEELEQAVRAQPVAWWIEECMKRAELGCGVDVMPSRDLFEDYKAL